MIIAVAAAAGKRWDDVRSEKERGMRESSHYMSEERECVLVTLRKGKRKKKKNKKRGIRKASSS